MTKVLGVPKDNPLVWQRALVEREINNVCSGQVRRAARAALQQSSERRQQQTNFLRRRKTQTTAPNPTSAALVAERRPVEMGDTCPVCLEELTEGVDGDNSKEGNTDEPHPKKLVYCKKGCGKNVHTA